MVQFYTSRTWHYDTVKIVLILSYHVSFSVKDEDSKDSVKKEKPQERINRNARLIIRNVSFKATEESLKEHFEQYGQLHEVKLLKKPDGKLVGCAFVHYKNVPMAKKALLETNMKPFLGKYLFTFL